MTAAVSNTLGHLRTAKAIWDHLKSTYGGNSVKQFAECMIKMLSLVNRINEDDPRPQLRELVTRIGEAKSRQESETIEWEKA